MVDPVQQALQEAQKWVSREELEKFKDKYRELAKMSRQSPLVRMIAALDRAYAAEGAQSS